MLVFSEKLSALGSWLVMISSMWNRLAKNRLSGRLEALVQAVVGSTLAKAPVS